MKKVILFLFLLVEDFGSMSFSMVNIILIDLPRIYLNER